MKLWWLVLVLIGLRAEGRVIVISVDGLRPDAITILGPEVLPNFYRLREEGAFTDNARTDFDYTETLPNHVGMVTGRPVEGPCGHGLDVNFGGIATNLHADGYKAGMFDVAHDHGFSTALFAGKSKFLAFKGSYSETTGAPDLAGVDNGRKKLDSVTIGVTDDTLMTSFLQSMSLFKWDLSFLHLRTPDSAGHSSDWDLDPESDYLKSIIQVDGYLGRILAWIDANVEVLGIPFVLVTSDHGGTAGTHTHVFPEVVTNYTIPFYVWGPGVKEGADLYELNPGLVDPGRSRPEFHSPAQPVRNLMVGNLALQLLGLPAIPGSCSNVSQSLRVNDAPDFEALFPGLEEGGDANGNGLSNFADYSLGADPRGAHRPDLMPGMEGRFLVLNLRQNVTDVGPLVEISADGRAWGPLLEGATFLRRSAEETPSGVRVRLEVPALLPRILLRQVMEPVR